MERQCFDIIREPRGNTYFRILDFAVQDCATAMLVVRPTEALTDTGTAVLAKLEPFLIKKSESSEWPGTKLLYGGVACVYQYSFNERCSKVLKQASNALYSWLQPDLPEDLCLLRQDRTPWLGSIAHEKDAYFELFESEINPLFHGVPELRKMVKKHLPPSGSA